MLPNEHPQRNAIEKCLREAESLHLSDGVRQKLQWFLYAIDHGNDAEKVSAEFGISPSTFRRWQQRFDPGNPQSLEEKSRRPHAVREPDTLPEVVALIRAYRERYPTMGKERIQEALEKEHGITLSPSTIGRVIRRERFFFANTLSHLHKRTPETPPAPGALPGDGSIVTGLLLIAVSLATFFAGAPQTDAAASTSFRLYSTFPNEATESPADSTNFQLNEAGVTWPQTPLIGSNFQVVAAPPASSSSSAASSSSEAEAPSQAGGGRRGRHPTIPPPRRPLSVPRTKPAAPVVPRAGEAPVSPGAKPVAPRETPRRGGAGGASSMEPGPKMKTYRAPVAIPGEYRSPLLPRGMYLFPTRREFKREAEARAQSTAPAVLRRQQRWGAELLTSVPKGTPSRNWDMGIWLLLIGLMSSISFAVGMRRSRPTGSGRARVKRKDHRLGAARTGHSLFWIAIVIFVSSLWLIPRTFAATVGPNKHVYNGHLLDSSSKAITTSHKIRFSYWKSADYVSTDTTSTGAIHAAASNYASWNEVHTVTPDSNGYFSVSLGSGTSLPSLANYTAAELSSLYLQVEVKSASAADTSYEILDVDTNNTAADRSPILTVPFALNADRVDQRDVGTGSGSIPFLQTGGLLPVSEIPDGTNQSTFIIDKDATSSTDITLTFGGTLAKRLWYDAATTRFNFDDDLHTTGNFTASGTLKVTGAVIFGSTVRINAVTYTFPYSDGASSGKVLKTSAAGILSWSDDNAVGTGLAYGDGRTYFIDDSGDSMTGALLIQTKTNGAAATADAGLQLEVVGTASGDHLHAQALLTASGTVRVSSGVTLNEDLDGNDVGIIFGSDTISEILSWLNAADRFEFSDDLHATGSLTSSGTLIINGTGSVKAETFKINSDQSAGDAVLVFGSDGTSETLKFLNAEDRFVFSDDLTVRGNLSGSTLNVDGYTGLYGALTVSGATTLKSTLRINNVTYTFPTTDGAQSGKILKTNGAGQLTWGNAGRSSGSILGFRPDYPNVAYFGSGASAVGTLSLRYSSGSEVTNYYRWQSTRTSNQHQWVSTQIRLPDTFSTWEVTKPLELRYRTNSGYITAYMLDTNDAPVTLSSNTNLRSSTWTTATITGPNTSGTWTPGDYFTILLRLTNSGATTLDKTYTDIGSLNISIEESLP